MADVELTDEQVMEAARRMPPARRRALLLALAGDAHTRGSARAALAEDALRRACRARGCDWDRMSEAEREIFVDALLHEDRSCAR